MAQAKQKRSSQSKSKNKQIVLFAFVVLLALVIVAVVVAKMFLTNQEAQDQRNLLNRSLEATKVVYDKFSNEVVNPKENTEPASGRCTSAGKYSSRYACGPRATLTVAELDESQYLKMNDRAVDIYRDSGYFTNINSSQPRQMGLETGSTGTADSILKDSALGCYYISNYIPEKRAATFSWGCKLVSNSQHF